MMLSKEVGSWDSCGGSVSITSKSWFLNEGMKLGPSLIYPGYLLLLPGILVFIGGTDAEAETPKLWPPDAKNWLIGKDWRQEKEMTEDEMVGWHHQLDGREFEQALGVGDGQGSLVCCSPWGHRVRHNWATKLNSLVGTLLWLYHRPPHAILLPYQCYSPLYTASLPLWCPPLSTSHNTGQNPPSNFSFLLPPLAQPIFLSPTLYLIFFHASIIILVGTDKWLFLEDAPQLQIHAQ